MSRAKAAPWLLSALFVLMPALLHSGPGVRTLAASPAAAPAIPWQRIDAGLAQAHAEARLVLVQVYASWCHDCHRMEQEIGSDAGLLRLLRKHLVPVRVDLQAETLIRFQGQQLSETALCRKLQINGPPTLLVLTPDGRQLGRLVGYRPPAELQAFLVRILNKYTREHRLPAS